MHGLLGKQKLQKLIPFEVSLLDITAIEDSQVVLCTKWDKWSMNILFHCFETPKNYDQWQNIEKKKEDGCTKPNGKKKKDIFKSIVFVMAAKEVQHTSNQVKNKIAHLEKQHHDGLTSCGRRVKDQTPLIERHVLIPLEIRYLCCVPLLTRLIL